MISTYILLTIAYIAGAAASVCADYGLTMIFSVCMLIMSGLKCLLKAASAKCMLLCCCFFLFGAILMSNSWYRESEILSGCTGRYTEVQGVVIGLPVSNDGYYSYTVQLENLNYQNINTNLNETVHLTSEMKFDTGNRLKFRGFLSEIDAPDNSTDFDYRTYYKGKGIKYRLHADEAELVSARAFIASPLYIGNYLKSRLAFAIDRFYTGDSAALMKSVLLGCRSGFSDSFYKILIRTSAVRFLHPSYLHMFLLISLCECCFVLAPKRKRELIILSVLFVYAVFSSDFNTFIKLFIMCALTLLYRRIRGFSHYPDIAAVTVLILLIANPLFLFASWFVISVSIGILQYIFYRPISARFCFIKNKKLRCAVCSWLIGTIGIMPFCAYYFYGESLYGIIFSLVYTPLSLLLFLIAPITLFMYEVFGGANIIGILCDSILSLMKNIPQLVSLLPGHYIMLGKTTAAGFVIYISFAAMLKLYMEKKYKHKTFIVSAAVCFSFIAALGIQTLADRGNLYAYFVNVGQGDGAVINIRGMDTILIDGGGAEPESTYNTGEKVFVPYLAAKGFNRIELAIVSHCHQDHAEGIIAAIENCRVHTVMLPDIDEKSEYRDMIIEAAHKNDTEIIYVDEGDRLDFKSGLVIEVLSPNRSAQISDENDASLVLKLTYGETTLFFGGDASAAVEKQLRGRLGQIDIVKALHHGSKTSSAQAFVDEVRPEYVIFSAGKNNMYGHPNEEVISRFSDAGAQILRTDIMGDIIIKADKKGVFDVRRFKEEE